VECDRGEPRLALMTFLGFLMKSKRCLWATGGKLGTPGSGGAASRPIANEAKHPFDDFLCRVRKARKLGISWKNAPADNAYDHIISEA